MDNMENVEFRSILRCAEFEIAPGKFVGGKQPCFIIAEIGQNHQGDIEIAKQLIQSAVDCGVDCVKFQKSDLESRFTNEVLRRPYNSKNSWGDTYGEHRSFLEFSNTEFRELKEFAEQLGVIFTASAMDKILFMQVQCYHSKY
ncbi:sialic acid synthase [Trichonephila inaurata madagascariensis]|uniref:Sialic acid synthase n=1 Tax=Trichonephila inaurata madagascariensis TaxID=2747483 RepID=A0A8X6YNK2_9ARAC|nr:sialic acid synthase [Trichonephila inaurata madagascariensis]